MLDIKIYLACHRQTTVPSHPFFYPVQAGAALAEQRFGETLQDDIGDHISEKNKSYCELTVQYWAWKNQQADYYGFFHYRRYLSFQRQPKSSHFDYFNITKNILQQHGYTPETLEKEIAQYDLLLPYGEKTAETVYQKYAQAEHHFIEDLDLLIALLRQYEPSYVQAMEQYLFGSVQYYFNLYIMRQALFLQYCQWLFPLLERFDLANNWEKYANDPIAQRVDGYLAERLFGIWYTAKKQQGGLQYKELPWVYFAMGDRKDFLKNKMKNTLLPVGSRRKCALKRLRQAFGDKELL